MGFRERTTAVPPTERPTVTAGGTDPRALIERLRLCVKCGAGARVDGSDLCRACVNRKREHRRAF